MSKETTVVKETTEPHVMTSTNTVLPVQLGSDIEGEIKASQPVAVVKETTVTKE